MPTSKESKVVLDALKRGFKQGGYKGMMLEAYKLEPKYPLTLSDVLRDVSDNKVAGIKLNRSEVFLISNYRNDLRKGAGLFGSAPMTTARIIAELVKRGEEDLAEELLSIAGKLGISSEEFYNRFNGKQVRVVTYVDGKHSMELHGKLEMKKPSSFEFDVRGPGKSRISFLWPKPDRSTIFGSGEAQLDYAMLKWHLRLL
jgi:hypothetical protein